MRVFKFALMCVIALAMVGCEAMEPEGPGDFNTEPLPVKPTVPLKKRPIVPTSKLPRPRVAEVCCTSDEAIVVTLLEGAECAEVTIVEHDTRNVRTYITYDGRVELDNMSACAFDVVVKVNGQEEIYTVLE
jgi:hypothetical protein